MIKKDKRKIIFIGSIFIIVILLITQYIFYGKKNQKKSKASEEMVGVSFSPDTQTVLSQEEVTTTVKIKPQSDISIRGYYFKINFDPSKVEIKNIEYKLGLVSQGLGDNNSTLNTINQQGFITVQGEIQNSSGQILTNSDETEIVQITFKALTDDPSLTIDGSSASFYKINNDYSLSHLSAEAAEFNSSSVQTDSIILNIKLKFQGITKRPKDEYNDIQIRVSLDGNDLSEIINKETSFQADDQGIWHGRAVFDNLSQGSGYQVYIKGQKHLQRKICQSHPQEENPGDYQCSDGESITLNTGENDLDFSSIYLLAGDLKPQDSVNDSYDTSYIVNNLGKTDPSILLVADLNLDGIVDGQDYVLAIYALSLKIKYDEE